MDISNDLLVHIPFMGKQASIVNPYRIFLFMLNNTEEKWHKVSNHEIFPGKKYTYRITRSGNGDNQFNIEFKLFSKDNKLSYVIDAKYSRVMNSDDAMIAALDFTDAITCAINKEFSNKCLSCHKLKKIKI